MIFALLAFAALHGVILTASTSQMPIGPLPWFAVTIVVALAVIVVAAAIYMLAPILNSSAMQQWARFQVYEALLSIALIILFLGVSSLLFLNPQAGFSAAGLVPSPCTGATTIYTLSACDLSQFNTASYQVAGDMWAFSVVKALIPSASFAIQPAPQEGDNLEINFAIPNFLDASNTSLLNYIMGAVLIAVLVSQLQLILLSSSLLLLSLFFTIGLIARVFGISRSFGGAMIAFGIGLGIIYPLLISITYGYIDVAANTTCLISPGSCISLTSGGALGALTFGTALSALMASPLPLIAGTGAAIAIGSGGSAIVSPIQTFAGGLAYVFKEIGYIIAGLTLIPIINILIVDIFIVDFSRAVGEQMSFSMLFQGVI